MDSETSFSEESKPYSCSVEDEHFLPNLYMQSEKSKKAGNAPSTTSLVDFLIASYGNDGSEISLLEEDMNFNARAAALSVSNPQCLSC